MLAPVVLDMEGMIDMPLLQAQVRGTIGKLKENYRRALTMLFLEHMSREECIAALDMTPGAFYTMLSRALDAFRLLWLEQKHE